MAIFQIPIQVRFGRSWFLLLSFWMLVLAPTALCPILCSRAIEKGVIENPSLGRRGCLNICGVDFPYLTAGMTRLDYSLDPNSPPSPVV